MRLAGPAEASFTLASSSTVNKVVKDQEKHIKRTLNFSSADSAARAFLMSSTEALLKACIADGSFAEYFQPEQSFSLDDNIHTQT